MTVELREALQRAAATPRRDVDVAAVYQAGSRRRRRKTAAGALAAVLLIAGLTTSLAQIRNTPSVLLQSPPSTAGWHRLPEAPIPARYDHVAAWTGDEMLVWGGRDRGDTYFRDGAAFDRATQVWRKIPQAPIDGRVHAATAWTGRELLVVGGWSAPSEDVIEVEPDGETGMRYFRDGAAYDPATDSWRTIAPFPLRPRADATAVWTGQELLIWGGRTINTPRSGFFGDGAAYDPASDTWRILAAAPLSRRAGHTSVWTGSELVVYGGVASMNTFDAFDDGAAYDPATDGWRRIASGPETHGNPSMRFNAAVWTGEEMIIWTGRTTAAYNPMSDQWRRAADDPFPGFERIVGPDSAVWTGSLMLTWGGWAELDDADRSGPQADGAAYTPATDSWTRLEEGPLQPRSGHTLVWTGHEVIIWGGQTFTTGLMGNETETVDDGAAYIPMSEDTATHASEPSSRTDAPVPRAAMLEGTATLKGKAVAGAEVTLSLITNEEHAIGEKFRHPVIDQTRTDDRGGFVLHVPASRQLVEAAQDNGGSVNLRAEVLYPHRVDGAPRIAVGTYAVPAELHSTAVTPWTFEENPIHVEVMPPPEDRGR